MAATTTKTTTTKSGAWDYNRNEYNYGYETQYTGRRRLSGNYGRVWLWTTEDGTASTLAAAGNTADTAKNALIFEIKSFEAKITADSEDVMIGISKDRKITGLTGEGEMVILQVFDRGYRNLVENCWQKGHDARFTIVAEIKDPDAITDGASDRVRIQNVWINELEIMKFEKAAIVEKTIPFGFTPSDVTYESWISGPGIDPKS